jgi:hypothetical protein
MRHGIVLTTGDPRELGLLAARAEATGWDGAFTYDAIAIGTMDTYDPWVSLAAMAMTTHRITLGAIVFAPARRRPWKLAREAMSVDRLSNGRLVLPVGLGTLDDGGFGNVGEPTEARIRAELLDETLAILDGLWTGEPFAFEGRHYRFGPMTFRPTPVQQPRIPIWVIGAWPHERSMRRAIQWDGIIVQANDPDGKPAGGPEPLHVVVPWILRERASDPANAGRPFEIAVDGETPADDPRRAADIAAAHADAGATWWLESPWSNGSIEFLERRIDAGPPRQPAAREA